MTVIINKENPDKVADILAKKLNIKTPKGNLEKHFGKLKRKIDGLNYQILIRENED